MKIEKIELNGFKSFYDRTGFNLHSGITCVVGPNGCGKSNIVDAFRWVLGEQSAKTLRGEKMEEVIFNGTSAKKPKGMAEVTLHISGLNGTSGGNGGNGDNGIVTVSRRLYRSGESEYLINRNTCRLKDIKDLFLDTGLEVKSYSIIEQGRIGEILNSKPQERRFLIEEVAGVMKYKVRKAEAQGKLESSRLNLQRIVDIISEVKKQINTLDRLAKKAERYKVLAEELKSIELKINKRDYLQFKSTLAEVSETFDKAREEDSALRASLSTVESDYQTERIEIVQKEKELNAMLEEFQAVERSVAEIQKQIAVLSTEGENARRHAERITAQIAEFEHKTVQLNEKLLTLRGAREDLSSRLESFNVSIAEKMDFISGLESEINEAESAIEDKRKDIFRATETISSLNNDLTRFQSAIESMAKKEAGYEKEIEEITAATAKTEEEIGNADSLLLTRNNELADLKARKEDLTNSVRDTKDEIEALRNRISILKEELASDNSRLVSLREIASEALTPEILGEAEKLHVLGTLSDFISVDTRYEKAIEAVLADKLSGFILPSEPDIESAVSFIREKSLVRTALLRLVGPSREEKPAPVHDAIIGPAIDFVGTDDKYIHILRNILDHVYIVRDLASAFALKEIHTDLVFITPSGDVLDSAGTVFSGEGKEILKRKREIRELADRIGGKQNQIGAAEKELTALQESLLRGESELTGTGEKIVLVEKEISAGKIGLQNLQQEKDRLQRKRANIKIEIEQSQREKGDILKKVAEIESSIGIAASKRNELENALSARQQVLADKKGNYEQYRSELTEIKMEMTSYREKIEGISKEIVSANSALQEAEQKILDLRNELDLTDAAAREKKETISQLEEKQKTMVIDIDGRRAGIASAKELIEGMASLSSEKEKQVKGIRAQIDELGARLSALDVSRTESRLKMENIFNNTLQIHGQNIDLLETGEPSEEEIEKIGPLREKIQSIGPVNLGTIEEYEELTKRYEFLTGQQEDLTKSIEELEEAIRKINTTTRQRLKTAFVELNTKFGEIFKHLFNGGRAELILLDEQNILESGIDIIAQPPGKKLQNITLLSGGEKALTAISLIFAGFLIKPAPICILDEADAPLDDSNTDRYASLIRDLSSNTQFIVITHNRTTMEAADYIYGVTMEEPGSSKVISMQLTEA